MVENNSSKKNNNKKTFKVYLDTNPIDDIREYLKQYKGYIKSHKRPVALKSAIAILCTMGVVSAYTISHADNHIDSNNIEIENAFEGVPIPEETMDAWLNPPVPEKNDATLGHTKYLEDDTYIRNYPLDLNLGCNYEGFRYKLSDNELEPFFRYGEMFGVDPYIIMAMAAQESSYSHSALIPGGSRYKEGNAIGICQITYFANNSVTAQNVLTGEYETLNLSLANLSNYELNIKASCMMFQNALNKFNGNLYLALQSHNYNSGTVAIAVSCYALEIGKTEEEVMANTHDCGWIKYIEDIHVNPQKYIDWEYRTYGDAAYLWNVTSKYCPDNGFISEYMANGCVCTFDMLTNELTMNNETTKIK